MEMTATKIDMVAINSTLVDIDISLDHSPDRSYRPKSFHYEMPVVVS